MRAAPVPGALRTGRRASPGWGQARRSRRSAGRRPPPPRRCRSGRHLPEGAYGWTSAPPGPGRPHPPRGGRGFDRPGPGRRPRRPGRRTATASESTAISSASTIGAVGIQVAPGARDGRGFPAARARSSEARPATTSSPMRPRMALRLSPVRATSSDRERGPRACSSRTMAVRFARRTVSLRCPIASGANGHRFVFLSFKCAVVASYKTAVDVKIREHGDVGSRAGEGTPCAGSRRSRPRRRPASPSSPLVVAVSRRAAQPRCGPLRPRSPHGRGPAVRGRGGGGGAGAHL